MKQYILTTTGYTYLERLDKLTRHYKEIKDKIILPGNKLRLFKEDFLLLTGLLRKMEEDEKINLNKYKKLLRKENPTSKIKTVNFELTNQCNVDCSYCHRKLQNIEGQLEIEKVKETFRLSKELGISDFVLTGGESTLYPEFINLIKWLIPRKGEYNLHLETNGWWGFEEEFYHQEEYFRNFINFIEMLYKAGFKTLILGIDGLGPDHDNSRNSPGLYVKNMNIIKYAEKRGLEVKINTILSKKNIKYIPEFLRLMNTYGAKQINLGIPEYLPVNSNEFILNENDIEFLRDHNIFLDEKYNKGINALEKQCKKVIMPDEIYIKPDGAVTPCCWITNSEAAYGNINDFDLYRVLSNLHQSKFYKLHKNKDYIKLKSKINNKYFKNKFKSVCGACMIAAQFIDAGSPKEAEMILQKIKAQFKI